MRDRVPPEPRGVNDPTARDSGYDWFFLVREKIQKAKFGKSTSCSDNFAKPAKKGRKPKPGGPSLPSQKRLSPMWKLTSR